MKINLEILDAFYLFDKESIEELNTKELVPQMVFRRRLTKASKLVIEALHKIDAKTVELYTEALLESCYLHQTY